MVSSPKIIIFILVWICCNAETKLSLLVKASRDRVKKKKEKKKKVKQFKINNMNPEQQKKNPQV